MGSVAKKAYNDSEKAKAQRRAYRQTPRGKQIQANEARKHRTGFSEELYQRCRAYQGDGCAICGQWMPKYCCDHDHATRTPRGLLCRACNIGLGYYEKWQRKSLIIQPYEQYLASTPVQALAVS